MRGVVLAGGTGSRLLPLTKVTNKHLLPVGREPMIYHPIRKLVQAGIIDILVVTGTEHMGDVVGTLGSGAEHGCEITYRVQEKPNGIAGALALARGFAGGNNLCVILGDNLFEDDLAHYAEAYREQAHRAVGRSAGARVLLKEVSDPERFGVAEVRAGRVVGIEEKPAAPRSNLAVTGIYFYDPTVFDIIDGLRPSGRGELEVTDVNRAYLGRGELECSVVAGWWTDAGTHESLARANHLVLGGASS